MRREIAQPLLCAFLTTNKIMIITFTLAKQSARITTSLQPQNRKSLLLTIFRASKIGSKVRCSSKNKEKREREKNQCKTWKYSFQHYLNINSVTFITFIKNLHQDFVLFLYFLHPFIVLYFSEFAVSSLGIIAK